MKRGVLNLARSTAIATAAACASARPAAAPPPSASAAEPVTRAESDRAAAARARTDSTRRPYTPADIHFVSGMIGHHAQAIAMSQWAESHGASATIRTLAGRIINAQRDEITLMQNWLRDRHQPIPEADPRGMKMDMGGTTHYMTMPGMLTEEQMQQLDAARGTEFDRLFLNFMIQHHRGAVQMVKELLATTGAANDETVWKLANDVNVDQTTEITRMQQMLALLTIQGRLP
jgi:uncharacterized protein (DUF305 family)